MVRQTTEAFKDIDKSQLENIVIAYEPVWAIGTGKTATAQDANDTIAIIRDTMANLYCKDCAENKVRIQYGGSMNPKNAAVAHLSVGKSHRKSACHKLSRRIVHYYF